MALLHIFPLRAADFSPHATLNSELVVMELSIREEPFWPIDVYFLIAVNTACSRSLVEVAPKLDTAADAADVADADNEDEEDEAEAESVDDAPELSRSANSPGGGPGGGAWLCIADTNWLSVRLPLLLVSSRLQSSFA